MNPLWLLATVPVLAAPAPNASPSLAVRWELLSNRDQGQEKVRMAFHLRNSGKEPWAMEGWSLYFHFAMAAHKEPLASGLRIEHVSGDLFRLRAQGAPALAPGQILRVEFTSDPWVIKQSDAPSGAFLVFDSAPAKGQPLALEITPLTSQALERPAGQRTPGISPEQRYAENARQGHQAPADLLPTPVSLSLGQGTFKPAADFQVVAESSLAQEAQLAADILQPRLGRRPVVAAQGHGLVLALGAVPGQTSPEAYQLSVREGGLRLTAPSPAGLFYGLQSLQRLWPSKGSLRLLELTDAPRFAYRGFMLDVARNFQSKEAMLRVLDLMARLKLNTLHFHLTDDEGWRVEIPSLPELTQVGSQRGFGNGTATLPPAWGSGPEAGKAPGSGFYSRKDFIEILRYATARHIEVIPEIEMPGHARAAVQSMKERTRRLQAAGDPGAAAFLLQDPGDQSKYTSVQLYSDNVMDPGMPSTFAFIERVVDEVQSQFKEAGAPLRTLHMGGDELPGGAWTGSPASLRRVAEAKLKGPDDLWYDFYDRVQTLLQRRGIATAGWEEIALRRTTLDGQPHNIPNPDFATRNLRSYVWNNMIGWGAEDLAYRLANAGYPVVLCPVSNLYFDMAYDPDPREAGYYWGGFNDLDKPFRFIPLDYLRNTTEDRLGAPVDPKVFVGKDRLTAYGAECIAGIQGCLWSETLTSPERLDYQLVPKLFALAERAWAPNPAWATEPDAAKAEAQYQAAWGTFASTVGLKELPRLDAEGPTFRYHIPTPGLKVEQGLIYANLQVPGFTLRYTTDGSEPGPTSPVWSAPVSLHGTIRVAAFNAKGRRGLSSSVTMP
ncbi:family 20 glycosylhydrolase [Geothrix sp. PMB-07]|uniref:family 20 glycosylhydrolase n=1 Tax=Geothrix sp. PMB-07 TaxID=3068640 RepID=UPI00274290E4|nr:family 20 glycosylhydrolase [Geothrix sp. PMB-07]WLT33443.1 family 20 glycosylhydrolase [Geothrix sp. PMB-07]